MNSDTCLLVWPPRLVDHLGIGDVRVWERDFDRRPAELSAEAVEAAVSEILTHPSYCERVVTWDEGYYEAGEKIVPDDACHTAVMNVLRGVRV